jgi:hypothetical protein
MSLVFTQLSTIFLHPLSQLVGGVLYFWGIQFVVTDFFVTCGDCCLKQSQREVNSYSTGQIHSVM